MNGLPPAGRGAGRIANERGGDGTTEPGEGTAAASATTPPAGTGAPETRGRTEIADRVVERIAARAVAETAQAGGAARRLLGVSLERGTAVRPAAHVDGHLATVRMPLSVPYPAPIRQVTRRVREHVRARVGELTGLEVRQVDIGIEGLSYGERGTKAEATATERATPAGPIPRADGVRAPRAADHTGQRRAAARAFRPRRSLPATLLAAVLAVAAVLTVVQVIAAALGRRAYARPAEWLAGLGRGTRFDDPVALAVATLVLVLGITVIVVALKPGFSRVIALASPDRQTVIGITRAALCRRLAAAAGGVDGIARARARVGRRQVRVRAVSSLHDTSGLAAQVCDTVTDRLRELAPLRPLRVRCTVRRRD